MKKIALGILCFLFTVQVFAGPNSSPVNVEKTAASTVQAADIGDDSKTQIQNLELINQTRSSQRNLFIIISLSILVLSIVLAVYLNKVKNLNKKLVESNAIKDKLFSIIGHDLRSPVSNVVQMMDILGNIDFSSEERSEIIATLKKHSESSLETLDNLLQWGKAQLQGIRVKHEDIFPQIIIERNVEAYAMQAEQKSITIKNLVPENLIVHADADHLNFIMRNLISNAVKFTYPSGTIIINAFQHSDALVCISIKDHGIGMSPENKKTIFKTFPVITPGTANEKGTGIGLMLCKEFVEANGGSISVDSVLGKGTTFSFMLKGSIPALQPAFAEQSMKSVELI
ncbi:HAMP domain-containing histidine kinase [Flavihumibacter sp. R14]|nr:HAMP domain-containing histidine kinase [Flavihumibacter soli]